MVEGDALLAAILANPADDLPRLVYADWLRERGYADREVRIEEHEYVGEYESGGIDRILRLAFSRRWPGVAFTLPEQFGTPALRAGVAELMRMDAIRSTQLRAAVGFGAPVILPPAVFSRIGGATTPTPPAAPPPPGGPTDRP
jgi:uncharacterized protein (TIGR02996 family)